MYKISFALAWLFYSLALSAQNKATITVVDEQGQAFQGLQLQIVQLQKIGFTDSMGTCTFRDLPEGTYALSIDYLYDVAYRTLKIRTGDTLITIRLERRIEFNEILVQAYQLSVSQYANSTKFNTEKLLAFNKGKDIPFILRQAPGVIVQSDAGNGIGYTGMRFRGLDPSHIQMSINGIPFTDAESSLSYFVDIPNIIAGTKELDLIRGNVPNKGGAPSFGGALDIQTNSLHFTPFAELNTEIGSFGTFKYGVQGASGLVGDKWHFEAGLSRLKSDGYIDRSSSDLKSFRLSSAIVTSNYAIRLNYMHGSEITGQAWYGLPWSYENEDSLRRFNFAGTEKPGTPYDHEIDQYSQDHLQFFYQREFSKRIHYNLISNYTHGKGYYENYKANQNLSSFGVTASGLAFADLVRQKWLENDYFFLSNVVNIALSNELSISPQLGYSYYHGDHFGIVKQVLANTYQYQRSPYYKNLGLKKEATFGLKARLTPISNVQLNLDVQLRMLDYKINGTEEQKNIGVGVNYTLFTPKLFANWTLSHTLKCFASLGIMRREAFREDLLTTPDRPEAEKLTDGELGFQWTPSNKFSMNCNGFYMYYDRLRALSGALNEVGEPLRIFLEAVHSKGLECELEFKPFKNVEWKQSAAFLWTRIPTWEEAIPHFDSVWNALPAISSLHTNVPLGFSPKFVSESRLSYRFKPGIISLPQVLFYTDIHAISSFYLDNSGSPESKIAAQQTIDLGIEVPVHFSDQTVLSIWIQVHNILGAKTNSHGWISRLKHENQLDLASDPYLGRAEDGVYYYKGLYPQALHHFSAGFRLRLN